VTRWRDQGSAPPGSGGGSASTPGPMAAVVRTYRELRGKGQPDRFAFEAALTVYFWHHPLVSAARAGEIVAGWVRDSGVVKSTFH
jgi:hypothetical protein